MWGVVDHAEIAMHFSQNVEVTGDLNLYVEKSVVKELHVCVTGLRPSSTRRCGISDTLISVT
jgi:hypothetical protein